MTERKAVRILLANGSLPFRTAIQEALRGDPDLEIAGASGGAADTARKARELSADVIVADAVFPEKGGPAKFTEFLQNSGSCPIVAVGPLEEKPDWEEGPRAADSYVVLPVLSEPGRAAALGSEIRRKIRQAARRCPAKGEKFSILHPNRFRVIAIGASTGGTEATAEILRNLPPGMPGIVIVQHMPPDFTRMFAERLDRISRLKVSEAKTGDRVEPGTALVAAGGKHLYLEKGPSGYRVRCAAGKKVNGHCPSVDELFNSVAETAGREAVGIILTGMGSDGARGLLNMRQAGALTIGQDEKSSVVYGMPMAAHELGAVEIEAPCGKIAGILTAKAGGIPLPGQESGEKR